MHAKINEHDAIARESEGKSGILGLISKAEMMSSETAIKRLVNLGPELPLCA